MHGFHIYMKKKTIVAVMFFSNYYILFPQNPRIGPLDQALEQKLIYLQVIFLNWYNVWFCFFFCLSGVYRHMETLRFTGEGLQVLIHARHSLPLSSQGSLACHTYCDTDHPFIIFISEDSWHYHLLPSI